MGSADIQVVSLHQTEIDPPPVKVWQYNAQECCWWVDDAGDLNIAMHCARRNPMLGKYGRVDLDLSLVLAEPPAGSGRNYAVRSRELRGTFRSALQNARLASQAGIVAVTVLDDGTLRGSFRIWTRPRTGLQLLPILLQRPGRLLCFGTFHAVKDKDRGRAIRARCESDGWGRPPRKKPTAATRPASRHPGDSPQSSQRMKDEMDRRADGRPRNGTTAPASPLPPVSPA